MSAANDGGDTAERIAVVNGHKISIVHSSKRSSILSALAIREEQNFVAVDELLDDLGLWNPYILFIVLCMSLCWGLSIMSVMCAAFYEAGVSCDPADRECVGERWQMFTIEDQFHIHGDSALSIEWTASVFFIGDLFGGVTLSYMSDVVGRRPVVFPSMFLMSVFGIASTYAPDYSTFLVIRFFEGFFFTASCVIVWIHASECVSTRLHASAAVIFGIAWVVGYCGVGLLAKFVGDWRDATLLTAIPTAVLSLILFFIIPESFHFLAEHSRAAPVRQWLKRADRNLFEVALLTRIVEERPVRHDFRQFVRFVRDNRIYVLYAAASAIIWICTFMTYMGMSMYSTVLGGNAVANFVASGIVELPAYLLAPLLLDRLGRRRTLIAIHLFTMIGFLTMAAINQLNRTLFVPLWMATKFGTAATFLYLFVFGSEIFPTVIRNTAMGLCAVCSNLGAIVGPHVRHTASVDPALPWLIFGGLGALSALCALALPETRPPARRNYSTVDTDF